MQKLIAILQVKSRNFLDFKLWLDWYTKFIKCDIIYILDDNSIYDITKMIDLYKNDIRYIKMDTIDFKKYDSLRQLANLKYILENNEIKNNDIIITPDDDEFWWYNKDVYSSFKDCMNDHFLKFNTDAISVPWILMGNKEYLKNRKDNYIKTFHYRNTLKFAEHKTIISFNRQIDSNLHNLYKTRKSISKLSDKYDYASECVYDSNLRCYHFRFTTIDEFVSKRSSTISTKKIRFYMNEDFSKQIIMGENQNAGYDMIDNTLLNELMNINN